MDVAEALNGLEPRRGPAAVGPCPRCAEPAGRLPGIATVSLGGGIVRRCLRCGTRATTLTAGRRTRFVFSCRKCSVPFVADELLPHDRHRCEDCADGVAPHDDPTAPLAEAMEREVRVALSSTWRFVGSASLSEYLDRIAREVARRIEAAPRGVRVVLADDPAVRSLALPSGLVILSVGLLTAIQDEAELAFVLGHEIAHAASRDAEHRLVRLGFHAAVREDGNRPTMAWSDAVADLVALGYGRRRERDADARAIDALVLQQYDPNSVVRFLHRLDLRGERGETSVAEVCCAHPPPADRIRRAERTLFARGTTSEPTRVNREVYRRVVSRAAIARMRPLVLEPDDAARSGLDPAVRRGLQRALWIGGGVALLAGLLLVVGLALAH